MKRGGHGRGERRGCDGGGGGGGKRDEEEEDGKEEEQEEKEEKEWLTGWQQQTRSKPNLPVLPLATTTTYRTITCNQSISGLSGSSFSLSLSSLLLLRRPLGLSSFSPFCPMHRVCAGIVESPRILCTLD